MTKSMKSGGKKSTQTRRARQAFERARSPGQRATTKERPSGSLPEASAAPKRFRNTKQNRAAALVPSLPESKPISQEEKPKVIIQIEKRPDQTLQDKILYGSHSPKFADLMAAQVLESISGGQIVSGSVEMASAVLSGINGSDPRDEFEAMLMAQMACGHNAAMLCLRRASHPQQDWEIKQANLTQFNKLSRTFAMCLDTLDRHRGKGQQSMEVRHVYVADGGQAIIGNITRGEGVGPIIKDQPVETIARQTITDARISPLHGEIEAHAETVSRSSS